MIANTTRSAQKYTNLLAKTLHKNGQYLTEQERVEVQSYITEAKVKIADRSITDVGKSIRAAWNKHNFRYGVASIKGYYTEVWVAANWNKYLGDVDSCRLVSEDKKTQVRGYDVEFSKPSWKNKYYGQIKTTKISKVGDIEFRFDWLKYPIGSFDRLVVADPTRGTAISIDYTAFKLWVLKTTPTPDPYNKFVFTINTKELIKRKQSLFLRTFQAVD